MVEQRAGRWTGNGDGSGKVTLTVLPSQRDRYERATTWAGTIRPATKGRSVRRLGSAAMYGDTDLEYQEWEQPYAVCWCGRSYVKVTHKMARGGMTMPCSVQWCKDTHQAAIEAMVNGDPLPLGQQHGKALDGDTTK